MQFFFKGLPERSSKQRYLVAEYNSPYIHNLVDQDGSLTPVSGINGSRILDIICLSGGLLYYVDNTPGLLSNHLYTLQEIRVDQSTHFTLQQKYIWWGIGGM